VALALPACGAATVCAWAQVVEAMENTKAAAAVKRRNERLIIFLILSLGASAIVAPQS
jgi:hypothetical protein